MRGDGRTFKRGKTWWMSFYVDGREQRESTKTNDEEKARKTLRARLKEVHAHELDLDCGSARCSQVGLRDSRHREQTKSLKHQADAR